MRLALIGLLGLLALAAPAGAAEVDPRGQILVSTITGGTRAMHLIDADGKPLAMPVSEACMPCSPYQDPSFSSDSRTIAFSIAAHGNSTYGGIFTMPAGGGARATLMPPQSLVPEPTALSNSPAFAQDKDDFAIAFQHFRIDGRFGIPELHVIDRNGTGHQIVTTQVSLTGIDRPAFSADGKTIAFVNIRPSATTRGGSTLMEVPRVGGVPTLLASIYTSPGTDIMRMPVYSPDGKSIAFLRYTSVASLATHYQRIVVLDLKTKVERVVAEHDIYLGPTTINYEGSLSWSPDSKRLLYIENDTLNRKQLLVSVAAQGPADRKVLLEHPAAGSAGAGPYDGIHYADWTKAPGPNYYIRQVEVAQVISPTVVDPKHDPLREEPYEIAWTKPSVAGSQIPLAAGRSTLLRIYVGDANQTEPEHKVDLEYRITSSDGTVIDKVDTVTLRPDGQGLEQKKMNGSINVWLPPAATDATFPVTFKIELNHNQSDEECGGCWPHGNVASLSGVRFDKAGRVLLVPLPVTLVDLDGTTHPAKVPLFRSSVVTARALVPVAEAAFTSAPLHAPAFLATAQLSIPIWGCANLLAVVNLAEALDGSPGVFAARRYAGFVDHPKPESLEAGGCAHTPSTALAMITMTGETLVHELGHSLGLDHTMGLNGLPPGARALPYVGIGGVAYRRGAIIDVFGDGYSDIMSYGTSLWTSPDSWQRMFDGILASSGGPIAPRLRAAPPTRRVANRRIVSGALTAGAARIFASIVAPSLPPQPSKGAVQGRLIAKNKQGRIIANLPIRARKLEPGVALSFLMALPARAPIASLEVRNARGKRLLMRRASANPPSVSFVALPRKLRASQALIVKLRARDADAGALTLIVQARRGSGRWQTISVGPPTLKPRVKASTLGKRGALQLRVRVSDGFKTTSRTSRLIRMR